MHYSYLSDLWKAERMGGPRPKPDDYADKVQKLSEARETQQGESTKGSAKGSAKKDGKKKGKLEKKASKKQSKPAPKKASEKKSVAKGKKDGKKGKKEDGGGPGGGESKGEKKADAKIEDIDDFEGEDGEAFIIEDLPIEEEEEEEASMEATPEVRATAIVHQDKLALNSFSLAMSRIIDHLLRWQPWLVSQK